jgi:hypothetical protein
MMCITEVTIKPDMFLLLHLMFSKLFIREGYLDIKAPFIKKLLNKAHRPIGDLVCSR